MFSEKDLVFPAPKDTGKEYLNQVMQNRTTYLTLLRKGNIQMESLSSIYLSLIKQDVAQARIEGMAQLLTPLEKLTPEEQKEFISLESLYLTGQEVKVGTLYLDGVPKKGDGLHYFNGISTVEIGNKTQGYELSFIAVNIGSKELLVSSHNLLCQVSWDQLNKMDLIYGKSVNINRQDYWLRSLSGEAMGKVSSEWDTMTDLVGEDNDIWHWKDRYSWCQEPTAGNYRVVRGFGEGKGYSSEISSNNFVACGWRPVLELV